MKASVVDLRYRMKDILKALDRNETVTITYHGKPRAKLVPIDKPQGTKQKVCEHPAFGMWADHKDKEDVAAYVRKLRRGRYHDL